MPISEIDGCDENHWKDIKDILTEAIESANCKANLVSDADDVGVIQKRIIQNLYDNPIVVCDVSGKNPNVMFELGMRLAFDKPTIIVKDDFTPFSFDTSSIEHLSYPRDLRFSSIVEFKKSLSKKIEATLKNSRSDSNFTTFLKHFGKYKVTNLETEEVSKEDFIIEEIRELRSMIVRRENEDRHRYTPRTRQRYRFSEKQVSILRKSLEKALSSMPKKEGIGIASEKLTEALMEMEEIHEAFESPSEVELCLRYISEKHG